MTELPEHEIRYVTQYVESQTDDNDDSVKLVQRVGSRRIAHVTHELYDVWTEKDGRWWVITEPTNLYNQSDFNSVDQALTYHLGLGLMLRDRARGDIPEDDEETFSPAWRRFGKAIEAMNDATEAEDYQAVGIRCREALLAYVRHRSAEEWLPDQEHPPQLANFKAWAEIFAQALTTGRARAYLKATSEKTWDLTVWLQHYSDASEWDAEMVLDATAHALKTFDLAILRHDRGASRRCPRCDSYRVTEDGDVIDRDGQLGWLARDVCTACNWLGDEHFEPFTEDHLRRLIEYHSADGE